MNLIRSKTDLFKCALHFVNELVKFKLIINLRSIEFITLLLLNRERERKKIIKLLLILKP